MGTDSVEQGTNGKPGGDDGARSAWQPEFMPQLAPVLHQLAQTFWAFKQAYAHQFNLPPAAVGFMAVLADRDGLTQQELTKTLCIDPSLITRAAKVLEHERGWIRRVRDPVDNRLLRVYLTEEGKNWAIDLPQRARELEHRLLHALSEADRATLRQLLHTLEDAARQDAQTQRTTATTATGDQTS